MYVSRKKIKREEEEREEEEEKKEKEKRRRGILQENGSSEVVNANERNARVAVGRAEHSEEQARKYHSSYLGECVEEGREDAKVPRTSNVGCQRDKPRQDRKK